MKKIKEETIKPVWTEEDGNRAHRLNTECCPLCDSSDTYVVRSGVIQRRELNGDDWWETEDEGDERYGCNSCDGYISGELTTMSILPEFITVGSIVKTTQGEITDGVWSRKQELISGIYINKENEELGYYKAYSEPSQQEKRFLSSNIKEVLSYGEVNNG